jgi:hypothetical protein
MREDFDRWVSANPNQFLDGRIGDEHECALPAVLRAMAETLEFLTMLKHKLQITLDEATGTLSCVHRVSAETPAGIVSHGEDVPLEPGAADALKAIIDSNREEMEKRLSQVN